MTGNGKHTTYIFMMMTEGWFIVLLTLGRVIGGPPIRILHGFSMHVNYETSTNTEWSLVHFTNNPSINGY